MLTVMDGVTSPVDHTLFAGSDDVSVTLPPAQKVVGPLADIVGIAPLTTTEMSLDGTEVQPPEL